MNKVAIDLVGRACTGCESCVSCCPHRALAMVMDAEGFYYPALEECRCVHCGLCVAVCPVASSERVCSQPLPDKAIAGSHREEAIRLESASGGAFSALVSAVKPDFLYGTAWTDAVSTVVMRTTPDQMSPLRGSKYIQSRVNDAYIQVRQDLKNGNQVLFSGTPCQIAGLLSFLGKRPENLITVELICHGIGSPGIFHEYLALLEKKTGSPVKEFSFRRKDKAHGGWESFHTTLSYENGKTYRSYHDTFTDLFLEKYILRPSCENCPFRGENAHVGDLIIGDYWGCSRFNPELYIKTGVSVILPLTQSGQKIAGQLSEYMNLKVVPTEYVVAENKVLLESSPMPQERTDFFEHIAQEGIESALIRFAPKISWRKRLKPYLIPYMKRFQG